MHASIRCARPVVRRQRRSKAVWQEGAVAQPAHAGALDRKGHWNYPTYPQSRFLANRWPHGADAAQKWYRAF